MSVPPRKRTVSESWRCEACFEFCDTGSRFCTRAECMGARAAAVLASSMHMTQSLMLKSIEPYFGPVSYTKEDLEFWEHMKTTPFPMPRNNENDPADRELVLRLLTERYPGCTITEYTTWRDDLGGLCCEFTPQEPTDFIAVGPITITEGPNECDR